MLSVTVTTFRPGMTNVRPLGRIQPLEALYTAQVIIGLSQCHPLIVLLVKLWEEKTECGLGRQILWGKAQTKGGVAAEVLEETDSIQGHTFNCTCGGMPLHFERVLSHMWALSYLEYIAHIFCHLQLSSSYISTKCLFLGIVCLIITFSLMSLLTSSKGY